MAPNEDASANAVAFDSSDGLWVGGYATDSSGSMHWLIRYASNLSSSFSPSDDYQKVSTWDARANAIAVSGDGTVWAVGNGLDSSSVSHWIVRSLPANGSWSTSEDYRLAVGYSAEASSVTVDAAGDVFVAGYATDSSGTQHWIVREKPYGGSWALSEDYQPSVGQDAYATGIAYDSANNIIYASGFESTGSGKSAVVRKYALSLWSSADRFQLSGGQDSFSLGIAVDGSSNVYSIGYALDASAVQQRIIRNLPSGGSWTTQEFTALGSGQAAFGQGIAAAGGAVYSIGYAMNSSTQEDWLTRVLNTGSTFTESDDVAGTTSSDVWLGAGVALNSHAMPVGVGRREQGSSSAWIVRVFNE